MNFDLWGVLRHAWQITWTQKALWLFSALPMVPLLFYLPLPAYFFLSNDAMNDLPSLLDNPTVIVSGMIALLATGAISVLLQVFGRSATTFGVVQLERGNTSPTVAEIAHGGRSFFWPTLAAALLAGLGTLVFLAAFSAALALVGFVTFGIGSVIGQFLFLPATLLFHAVLEQSQSALVADALSPAAALRRAWGLVKKNLGIFALTAFVLYAGLAVLSSVAMLPVTAPLLVAVLSRFSGALQDDSLLRIALACFTIFAPLYLFVQALIILYIRSVHTLVYLRLTRSPILPPLPGQPGGITVKESQ